MEADNFLRLLGLQFQIVVSHPRLDMGQFVNTSW